MNGIVKSGFRDGEPEPEEITAGTVILAGGKEQKVMHRSAELLHTAIANSKLQILNQYDHGEFSLNHPKEYADLVSLLVSSV